MTLKKEFLKSAQIYLILDADVKSLDALKKIAVESAEAGVGIMQIRAKSLSAQQIISFLNDVQPLIDDVPLCVNDRLDVAWITNARALHLGQDDISISDARRLLGNDVILGKSCQSLEHVKEAVAEGADYIGFGSIYKTLTKPDRDPMDWSELKAVIEYCPIPIFPIGGITAENLPELIQVGVKQVAVCRDILLADDIEKKVKKYSSLRGIK